MKACVNCEGPGNDCFEIEKNPALKRAVKDARRNHGARQLHQARHPVRAQGYTELEFDTYDTDWDGEAYRTVSGQNSNNSVRVTDDFLNAVESGRRLEPECAPDRQDDQDAQGPRPLGQDRLCRLGFGRSRHPVPHHDQ